MNKLEYNLFSKHKLCFNKEGNFKILMFSDLQEDFDSVDRALEGMKRVIDKENPDLVMLGGDNIRFEEEEPLKPYLKKLTEPMEKKKIPWIHIFGNHDHDIEADPKHLTKIYEEFDYCLSKHNDEIYGATNYVVPIFSSDGSDVAYALWALDTNRLIANTDIKLDENFYNMKRPVNSNEFDIVHFDQIMWYWNTSCQIQEYAKHLVPGIMFMHIPPWEFQFLSDNRKLTNTVGITDETMNLGCLNSGIFAAVLQRKDIKCIACGHCHENDFDGVFCGVRCCMDACAGYHSYGSDDLRGGRLFILNENNPDDITTYMLRFKDI